MRIDVTEEEIKLFIEEIDEQIQIFEESLLKLEKNSEDIDLLSKIFRCAHTLKGSSFTLGHDTIGKLTHCMENMLDKLRKNEMKLTPQIANILLEGLDILKVLKLNLENNKTEDEDSAVEPFIKKIQELCKGKKEEDAFILKEEIEKIIEENKESIIYKIYLKMSLRCDEIEMRISQIFSYLSDVGEIYKSKPTLDEVENEEVGKEANIILISEKKKEEIEEVLRIVPDVEKINIEVIFEGKQDKEEKLVSIEQKQEEEKEEEKKEEGKEKKGKSIELKTEDEKIEEVKKEIVPMEKTSIKEPSQPTIVVGKSVKIEVEKLDNFIDLLGEFVIDRTRIIQLGMDLEDRYEDDSTVISLNRTFEHLDRIATELYQKIMKTRLLPMEVIFGKFPRMIRDLCMKSGKKINFKISGEETELDRQIIDQIADPLTHILRNSADHGVEESAERIKKGKPEEGNIILSAQHQEDHIMITVEDDGKGIDIDRIKEKAISSGLISKSSVDKLTDKGLLDFVFISGFSTKEVASEVSGRGVGMDIVRTNIEKLGGSVAIQTEKDKGTKITMKLPLTLAIVNSLLVRLDENIFAFPLFSVAETLTIKKEEIRTIRKKETINLRGEVLPILKLKEIFEFNGSSGENKKKRLYIVVVNWSDKKAGFIVDSLIGDQEIVIKPLSPLMEKVDGIAGASVLGSGEIALILDISSLIKSIIEEQVEK